MALVIHDSYPTLREQVRHNFQSVTNQSYRPLEVPDGKYPLPWNMHQTSSGYSREKPSAATPTKEVSETPRLGWRKGRGGGGQREDLSSGVGLCCQELVQAEMPGHRGAIRRRGVCPPLSP